VSAAERRERLLRALVPKLAAHPEIAAKYDDKDNCIYLEVTAARRRLRIAVLADQQIGAVERYLIEQASPGDIAELSGWPSWPPWRRD
jgi:hypothetical protein